MDATEDISFTVRTFQKVLNNEKHRLAVGMALRNHLFDQIENGAEVSHYRLTWMHKGVMRAIKTLELMAREFNATHRTDKFSTADMIDVATSVVNTLKSRLGPDED